MLADWPEEDLRTFVELLGKMNKAAEKRTGRDLLTLPHD